MKLIALASGGTTFDLVNKIIISFMFIADQLIVDYKSLGILKRQFPNSPVLALTATATTKVRACTQHREQIIVSYKVI